MEVRVFGSEADMLVALILLLARFEVIVKLHVLPEMVEK